MTGLRAALLLVLSLPARADPGLERVGREQLRGQSLAGLCLATVEGGRVAYLGGFGYEDAEAKVPVSCSRTLFRWASVSKTLTAAAALRAAARGELDLDADIRARLPDWAPPAPLPSSATVTTRMLLGHTSGAPHCGDGPNPILGPPAALTASSATNAGFAWALSYSAREPFVAIPGREYHYSSYGYNLAGAVLERAAGKPFWPLVRNDLARPAGLATLSPDYPWARLARRAVGYSAAGSSGTFTRDGDSDVTWKLPAGGFVSSGEDLARWCAALLGGTVLTGAMKSEAWVPGPDPGYGLGFMLGRLDGRRWVGHNGRQEKASAWLMLLPDEGLCAVALSNSSYGDLRPAVEGALRAMLRRRRGG